MYIFLKSRAFSPEDLFEILHVKDFANKVIYPLHIHMDILSTLRGWNKKIAFYIYKAPKNVSLHNCNLSDDSVNQMAVRQLLAPFIAGS